MDYINNINFFGDLMEKKIVFPFIWKIFGQFRSVFFLPRWINWISLFYFWAKRECEVIPAVKKCFFFIQPKIVGPYRWREHNTNNTWMKILLNFMLKKKWLNKFLWSVDWTSHEKKYNKIEMIQ
jgi:hypothetical protein